MRWQVLSGVVVLAVLSGSGCFQRSEPSKSTGPETTISRTAQAIQGGTTDDTDKFAVGVCGGPAGECYAGLCSGALILPNVVATARHCVSQSPERINCDQKPSFGAALSDVYTVTTNTTIDPANSGWYSVKSVYVPDDDHICGNDMALLVLNKSIPANVATPITPGVQYLMWDPVPKYSMTYTGIGYGATNASSSDGSGTRRILKQIKVQCVPGTPTTWLACPSEINVNEFVGGSGTCHGDSGSSAYESNSFAKGAPVSFGVLSRGDDSGDKCGLAIYSRFDAHRDFILKIAKEASNNWSLYPEPAWTEEKPRAVAPPPTDPKKDAGTADEGDEKSKLGETCTRGRDCKSGVCAIQDEETSVCSQDCEDADGCPNGFECRESLCLAPLSEEEEPSDGKTSSKSSCAVVSAAPTEGSEALAALAIAALSALRRRRRAA